MADDYVVVISGAEGLAKWTDLSKNVEKNASRAVNAAAARAKSRSADEISAEVNFPSNYLTGDRFGISKYATAADPEAVVRARFRATSLARFVTNVAQAAPRGRGAPPAVEPPGATVEVKPGSARFMSGTFLIRLRAGNADLDTKNNMGLAIRLRGTPILNKRIMAKSIDKGLYLLYGPSVAQVFGGEKGVAEQVSEPIARYLAEEFDRLMDLDLA